MNGQSNGEREALLEALARPLRERGLAGVGALLARGLGGVGIVVSQLLLIIQPLVPHAGWRKNIGSYALLLEDQESWQTLIQLLEASDS